MNQLEQSVSDLFISLGFLVKPAQQRHKADPSNTIYTNMWIVLGGQMWQLDFVLYSARLAVEINGAYWHGSRTQTVFSGKQIKARSRDQEKAKVFRAHGWDILRIPEESVKKMSRERLRSSILSLLDI